MTVPMLDPEAALSSPAYASFGARLRALVVDSIVVSLGVVAIVFLGMVTSEVPGSGRVMVAGILALVLLYEPLMVWRFGGTIGHRRGNLLVVADETGGNPSLGRAMIRYAVKTALGALSFVTMALTRRHQAAHDRLSATTVQIRDITKAKPWDVRLERAPMSEIGIPSRSRRVGIIVVYLIVLFLAYAELFGLVVSSQCTMRHLCSAGERLVSTGLWLGWLGACAWCIIAGWRGRLIGARRGDIRPVDGAATLMGS